MPHDNPITDDLFEKITNISKAQAYDILVKLIYAITLAMTQIGLDNKSFEFINKICREASEFNNHP